MKAHEINELMDFVKKALVTVFSLAGQPPLTPAQMDAHLAIAREWLENLGLPILEPWSVSLGRALQAENRAVTAEIDAQWKLGREGALAHIAEAETKIRDLISERDGYRVRCENQADTIRSSRGEAVEWAKKFGAMHDRALLAERELAEVRKTLTDRDFTVGELAGDLKSLQVKCDSYAKELSGATNHFIERGAAFGAEIRIKSVSTETFAREYPRMTVLFSCRDASEFNKLAALLTTGKGGAFIGRGPWFPLDERARMQDENDKLRKTNENLAADRLDAEEKLARETFNHNQTKVRLGFADKLLRSAHSHLPPLASAPHGQIARYLDAYGARKTAADGVKVTLSDRLADIADDQNRRTVFFGDIRSVFSGIDRESLLYPREKSIFERRSGAPLTADRITLDTIAEWFRVPAHLLNTIDETAPAPAAPPLDPAGFDPDVPVGNALRHHVRSLRDNVAKLDTTKDTILLDYTRTLLRHVCYAGTPWSDQPPSLKATAKYSDLHEALSRAETYIANASPRFSSSIDRDAWKRVQASALRVRGLLSNLWVGAYDVASNRGAGEA